jgi:hypothetical protein
MSDTPDLGRIGVLRTLSPWQRVLRSAIVLGPATLVAALGLLVFHASLAASTVAPPAAVWSRPMQRRWARRIGAAGAATAAAWAAARALASVTIAGKAEVLTAGLVGLAVAAVWIRHRSLARLPGGPR